MIPLPRADPCKRISLRAKGDIRARPNCIERRRKYCYCGPTQKYRAGLLSSNLILVDLSMYPVELFHIHNFKGRPNLFASETRPLVEESWRLFTLRHCQGMSCVAAPPDSKVGSLPHIPSAMVEKYRRQTPFRTQLGFSGIWTPHDIHN